MDCKTLFKDRRLLIATKHGKEKVIAPILEKELHVKCFVVSNLDTDQLGTFTGEVERVDSPLVTLRKKCLMAMELAGCDLLVASEGSFGMHPTPYFIPADEEFLIFIDKQNDIEILVRELSVDTNFSGTEIKSEEELISFANLIQFPSHALILRKHKEDFIEIKKGITNWDKLLNTYNQINKMDGKAYVETDMRAMFNPTRMKVIEKATQKLAAKIKSTCPQCSFPGFAITDAKPGLPCKLCGFPTRSTLSYIYNCIKCNFTREENHPNGKTKEDPMYCDICNP